MKVVNAPPPEQPTAPTRDGSTSGQTRFGPIKCSCSRRESRAACAQSAIIRRHCVLLLQDTEEKLPGRGNAVSESARRLSIILTQEEAVRLIDSASNLFHRAMLMTLYSTGMRRAEMCHLKVEDIDSERMVVHIRHGKRNRDRDVPLSPKLLETLREYWSWMRPKTYLFPGQKTAGAPISRLRRKCSGRLAERRLNVPVSPKRCAPT